MPSITFEAFEDTLGPGREVSIGQRISIPVCEHWDAFSFLQKIKEKSRNEKGETFMVMSKDFFYKLCTARGWLTKENEAHLEKIYDIVEDIQDVPSIATAVWMSVEGVSREEIIHDVIDALDNGISLPDSSRFLNWEELKYLSNPVMELRKVLYSYRLCIGFSLAYYGNEIILYGDTNLLLSISNKFELAKTDHIFVNELISPFYDNFDVNWNMKVPDESKTGILEAVLIIIIKLLNKDIIPYHVNKISCVSKMGEVRGRRVEKSRGLWEIIF